jgi:hypothetical protein
MNETERNEHYNDYKDHGNECTKLLSNAAHSIYNNHKLSVPNIARTIEWYSPDIQDGCWLLWNAHTPIRWMANNSNIPFVAVATTLYKLENQRMNASTKRCRLKEFRSLQVNQRRIGSTPDTGSEREWVKSVLKGKFNHPCTINGNYRQPVLDYIRSKLLGVDPSTDEKLSW